MWLIALHVFCFIIMAKYKTNDYKDNFKKI